MPDIRNPSAAGGAQTAADYYLNGAGNARATLPRTSIPSTAVVLSATGIMTSYAYTGYAGDTVTNISFRVGGTAAVTPTNWWLALYDTSLNLIDQTADQLTTAIGANAFFTIPLGTPRVLTVTGVYYLSIMVKAATQPTLTGYISQSGALMSAAGPPAPMKQLVFSSGSGLTGTAPASIVGTTVLAGLAWMVAT